MRFARLVQFGAALVWALSCHADVRSTDGSTSWVGSCQSSDDCPGAQTCECGVCTYVCVRDAVCGSEETACARAGSPAFTATCGGDSTLAGVCLPKCPEKGCGAGRVCKDGLCTLSSRSADASRDAGPSAGGSSGTGAEDGGTAGTSNETGGHPVDPIETGGRTGTTAGSGGRTGTGSGGDGNIGPLASCDSFDDPAYRNGPPISFRNDLLPLFGLSCVVADCHSPQDRRAGLNLGYKCAYDQNAKWKCTFPTVPDPDLTRPQPEDEQTVADIYASLLAPALTVSGGLVKRVAPGDPANSFLVLSLADKQNSRGYICTNQDASHESNPPPCGVSMPQNQDIYCQGSYQPRFDAIVRWIAQGAKNN